MNLAELLELKYPHANFFTEIKLCDHGLGDGIQIQEWNLPDPQPTPSDIAQWMIDFDLPYRQKQVMDLRKSQYPTWNQQLDMQYNDAINNTTTWKDAIAAVKVANPIPTE